MVSKNISTKRKKKSWYGLYAPEALNDAFLGETHVYNPEDMVGKTVSMNLSMFTNDMKKQNIIASFRVREVKDNKGLTDLLGYSLSLAYIKRLVRRKRDKIDDSFLAKSKDGKLLRIKTVAMTNSKTHESAISAIRLSLRAKIKKTLKEVNFDEFVNSLINVRLQKDWKSSLSKIYPIKFLEVRYVALEDSKKAVKDEVDVDYTDIKSDEDVDDSDVEDIDDSDVDDSVEDVDDSDVEDIDDSDVDDSESVEDEVKYEDVVEGSVDEDLESSDNADSEKK